MSFWGAEVKPEKPYTHTHSPRRGRLRVTQATIGGDAGKAERGAKVRLQCTVKNKDPLLLCTLLPGQSETLNLDLEFEEKYVTFSVLGPMSVHLAGYYIGNEYDEDIGDSDTGSDSDDGFLVSDDDDDMVIPVSHGQRNTDSEDDDSEYDSDYDSEADDEDLMYNQRRGKSSVVIEEIQEDDKPASGEGQKGSNKKQNSKNGDDSRLQLAVRAPPAESLESEDEDGFPVSESKKSSKGSSKKGSNLNNGSNEDRKRKSGAISDHRDSSGEVKSENDGVSKKKKKAKDKKTAVDSENLNSDKKEIKEDSSANIVEAKQKKKKSKDASASEAEADQQDKMIISDNNAEEVTKQGAKKKNKKKKTKENNTNETQAVTDLTKPVSKEQPSQTRTFGNGMIVQTVALGKPDGKKASPGKKVSVKYIGKLKNGTIFDSTVGKKPFEFRLGVGQVIKGWDIGVNGMRIGDKRKITIPPSMGYGKEKIGVIPPNSTLVFDVELVNVK